jgi:hypothetical protein
MERGRGRGGGIRRLVDMEGRVVVGRVSRVDGDGSGVRVIIRGMGDGMVRVGIRGVKGCGASVVGDDSA